MLTVIDDANSYPPSSTLHLTGVDASIANAIPRTMIRWVKTVSLNPKIRSHFVVTRCPKIKPSEELRVTLEQVQWRIPAAVLSSEFDEQKGSELNSSNSLKFVLRKTHPIAQKERSFGSLYPHNQILITSGDVQWEPYDEEQRQRVLQVYASSLDHVCRPNYDDIILTLMTPGEAVDVTFYLTLSNTEAVSHYGGSPVCAKTLCTPVPRVTIIQPITDIEDVQTAINACPKNVFSQNDSGELQVNNAGRDCTHCMQCVREMKQPGRLRIDDVEDEYQVQVQTRNGIPVPVLVMSALDELIDTCDSYLEDIGKKMK